MTDKNAKNENSKIRIMTFFPPFIILVAFLVLSLVDQETFLGVINNINNWIIKNLGWAASILALAIVIVAVVAMFSKFGDVRIGGEDAKPELSNFSWFTIALTTTMAAGVLFWGPGEPIAHYAYPPTELYGVEPSTSGSLKFAMETMFLHWTFHIVCIRFRRLYLLSCITTRKSRIPSPVKFPLFWVTAATILAGCRPSTQSPYLPSVPVWLVLLHRHS